MESTNDTHSAATESSGGPSVRQPEPPLLIPGSALYLDFDGTLVDLAETPDRVQAPAGMADRLVRLHRLLGGALAIITGRRLESVDSFLLPQRFCGAGLHGAQLRLVAERVEPAEALPAIGEIAALLRTRFYADPRILVEDKGAAVALHYRLAPECADPCNALMEDLAASHGLNVVRGHLVIEARPPGVNKGVALKRLHAVAPFSGRQPVFLGDDTTDEDAILAAQAIGGIGIRIGAHASAAHYRLPGVSHVHRWLTASADQLETLA